MMNNAHLYSHPPLKFPEWINQNFSKFNSNISSNSLINNTIYILKYNLNKFDWSRISYNPVNIKMYDNTENRDFNRLSSYPEAIDLLKNNLDKVNWARLSYNPAAIDILKDNLNKVSWWRLSTNPAAIDIIKDNLDKVDWRMLSYNPGAIDILKNNIELVDWSRLSYNPAIFEIDYDKLKNKIEPFKEELMQVTLHPMRLKYYLDLYNYDIGEDRYCEKDEYEDE